MAITNAALAQECARLSRVASSWAADLLDLEERNSAPARPEIVARLLDAIRQHAASIERRALEGKEPT